MSTFRVAFGSLIALTLVACTVTAPEPSGLEAPFSASDENILLEWSALAESGVTVPASWKFYAQPKSDLEETGFSLRHPPDWNVNDDPGDGILYLQRFGHKDGFAGIDIDYCGERCGIDLSCEMGERQRAAGTAWEGCYFAEANEWRFTVKKDGRIWYLSLNMERAGQLPDLMPILESVVASLKVN
jgi:hypothetical protein